MNYICCRCTGEKRGVISIFPLKSKMISLIFSMLRSRALFSGDGAGGVTASPNPVGSTIQSRSGTLTRQNQPLSQSVGNAGAESECGRWVTELQRFWWYRGVVCVICRYTVYTHHKSFRISCSPLTNVQGYITMYCSLNLSLQIPGGEMTLPNMQGLFVLPNSTQNPFPLPPCAETVQGTDHATCWVQAPNFKRVCGSHAPFCANRFRHLTCSRGH